MAKKSRLTTSESELACTVLSPKPSRLQAASNSSMDMCPLCQDTKPANATTVVKAKKTTPAVAQSFSVIETHKLRSAKKTKTTQIDGSTA